MKAQLEPKEKVIVCDMCHHIFTFSSTSDSPSRCSRCDTLTSPLKEKPISAIKSEKNTLSEQSFLTEIILPKFERKLSATQSTIKQPSSKPKKAMCIKVCDVCYTIREVNDLNNAEKCPTCHPQATPKPQAPPSNIVNEPVFLPSDEEDEAPPFLDTPPPLDNPVPLQPEVITPVANEQLELEKPRVNKYNSIPIKFTAPVSHPKYIVNYSSGDSSKKELSRGFEQIKIPIVKGALVESDTWTNYKKQTFWDLVKSKLEPNHPPKKVMEDAFLYNIRQTFLSYGLLAIGLVITGGAVLWTLNNYF